MADRLVTLTRQRALSGLLSALLLVQTLPLTVLATPTQPTPLATAEQSRAQTADVPAPPPADALPPSPPPPDIQLPTPEVITAPEIVDPHLPSLVVSTRVQPAPVAVGETATVTITITNQAEDPADDLVVTLATPDGVAPVPGSGFVSAATGWRWSVGHLAGETTTTLTATMLVNQLPPGGALLTRVAATAQGLSLPVQDVGGTLVLDRATALGAARFSPGSSTTLTSGDGRVSVRVPAGAATHALTPRYSGTDTGVAISPTPTITPTVTPTSALASPTPTPDAARDRQR